MNHEDRNTPGIHEANAGGPDARRGPGPEVMGAGTLVGNDVYNYEDDELGTIKEIMLDMRTGRVSYAVLAFGSLWRMGEKLFAVPWSALRRDTRNRRFTLNVPKDRLKGAPGFDGDHWPNMADKSWANEVHSYYGTQP